MASLPLDTLKRIYDAIAEKGWANLSLSDVAQVTEMDLATLRGHLSSKYDLIGQLNRQIDAEVLNEVGSVDPDDPARDRLFEVMMARFDALEPFKDALGVMAMAARSDLHLAAKTRRSIDDKNNIPREVVKRAAAFREEHEQDLTRCKLESLFGETLQIWVGIMLAFDRKLDSPVESGEMTIRAKVEQIKVAAAASKAKDEEDPSCEKGAPAATVQDPPQAASSSAELNHDSE